MWYQFGLDLMKYLEIQPQIVTDWPAQTLSFIYTSPEIYFSNLFI